MNDDPIVSSVRRIRDQLASKFNYDVHAIFADMRERESKFGNRLVRHAERPNKAMHPSGEVGLVDNGESSVAAE